MKTINLLFFLSSGGVVAAFSPGGVSSPSRSSLFVSVATEFLLDEQREHQQCDDILSVGQLKRTFESTTPSAVGIDRSVRENHRSKSKGRSKRRHNYRRNQSHLREAPDLDFFTLHSSAVTHLSKDMPIKDILRAIKRAQNLHDFHDLATITSFLADHCDEHWGYGFRGSLLSRVAVAALHMNEGDLAEKAIHTRHVYERPSMQPHESAAIVRGLMRIGETERGWEVLEDELRLPMAGTPLDSDSAQQLLANRARSLTSIATRFFYSGEPFVAAKALQKLGELGLMIGKSSMKHKDTIDLPWERLAKAATACNARLSKEGYDAVEQVDPSFFLPFNLKELVMDTYECFQRPVDASIECNTCAPRDVSSLLKP